MRVLYAVDLEDDASDTGEGRRWLERLGASVELLYVEPPVPAILGVGEGPEMAGLLEAAIRRRETALRERLGERLAAWPPGQRGAVHLAYGRGVADEIATRAAGFDLVAVGTHGRLGASRAWLGSVAEKVVRESPVPVLVVRGSRAAAADLRILAAVDGWDESAERLIAEAARWAARLRGTVDLLQVVSVPIPPDVLGAPGAGGGQQLAALISDAEQRVTRLGERLPVEVRGAARAVWGEPASAIVAAAEDHDLLVVGTHGRSGLARLWLGSVAERAVRRSPTPVLVVPTREVA